MKYLSVWLILLLTGCESITPYVAYEHKSDPSVHGDGWDYGCTGVKYDERLSVKTGYCWSVRGGGMAEVRVEYNLFGRE